jgi:hypothetical protein
MQRQFHNPVGVTHDPARRIVPEHATLSPAFLDKLTVHEGRRRQKTATAAISAVTGY